MNKWIKTEDLKDEAIKCQECGQAPLRYAHYIVVDNDIKIVGSTCAKKFLPDSLEDIEKEDKAIKKKGKRRDQFELLAFIEKGRTSKLVEDYNKRKKRHGRWLSFIKNKYDSIADFKSSEDYWIWHSGKMPPKNIEPEIDLFGE